MANYHDPKTKKTVKAKNQKEAAEAMAPKLKPQIKPKAKKEETE